MSERLVRVLTGLISIVFFAAIAIFGIEAGAGKLSPKYHVSATFDAAGQGMQSGSDVKIHGINVGSVTGVHLVQGRARINMALHTGQKVPRTATATIRAKTLFGEKFVDIEPGPDETHGPFLRNHGVISRTVGGSELERVLASLYPILKAINPDELAVVLDTLAQGGEGEGSKINRQIVNWQKVSDVEVAHDAQTRQFLDDFARLTDELANRAPDLVAGARDLNVALPDLNAHAQDLTAFLDQAARLSSDLADVLEANRPFLQKNVTEGGKTLQVLFEERGKIPSLVRGLREFFQVLGEVADRIPDPSSPGTTLAAVKYVAGGGPPCGALPCTGSTSAGAPAAKGAGAAPAAPSTRPGATPLLPPLVGLTPPVHLTGPDAITALLGPLAP